MMSTPPGFPPRAAAVYGHLPPSAAAPGGSASANLACLLCLAWLLVACGPAEPASWDGRRSFVGQRTRLDPAAPGGRQTARPTAAPEDGCDEVLAVVPTFTERLAEQPPPAEVFDTMETCLLRRSRGLELLELTRRALELHPSEPDLHVRRARALLNLGDFDEAARACAGALKVAPRHPDALFFLGLTFGRRPEPSEAHLRQAVAAWRELLEVQPEPRGIEGYGATQLRRDLARFEAALGVKPAPSAGPGAAPAGAPAPPVQPAPDQDQDPTSTPPGVSP